MAEEVTSTPSTASHTLKELKYDGAMCVVECANRDKSGNIISSTYATKTALSSETTARSSGDTATLASAKEYTDDEISSEASARATGDSDTLDSAKSYTDDKVSAEATSRASGDASTLTSAKTYTDDEVSAEAEARKAADADFVTLSTDQTITGIKSYSAPTNVSGKEQATATYATANGGRIVFGKEASNSGTMIALEQVSGTRRLNFRSSATPGAMVWEQPESGSSLFMDVKTVNYRATTSVAFSNFKGADYLYTDSSGYLKKGTFAAATADKLGQIKIGYTQSGKNYPVLLDSSSKAYVNVPWTDTTYTLPTASSDALGGIKTGYSSSGRNYAVQLSDGKAYVNVPWTDTTYTLPTASSTALGGVKSSTTGTTSGRDYLVQVNDDGTMKVNVPWANTDTHYTTYLYAGTGAAKNASTANGNTKLTVCDNTTARSSVTLKGSGSVSVSSDATGVVTINGTDADTTYSLSGSGATVTLTPSSGTATTITINNVANATNATSATTATNVSAITNNDSEDNANVKFAIGNKSYSKTVNNVEHADSADTADSATSATTATTATTATNVGTLTNNDTSANANVKFTIGDKSYSKTINNVANATSATKATQDGNGNVISSTYVKYATSTQMVAGTSKSVSKTSPTTLYAADGLIMGGTAKAAGLTTRGICGVTTPDSNGACAKDNLFVNYDGDDGYSRKLVLGAGSTGTAMTGGAYTYCAVRGDQMASYVASVVPEATEAIPEATLTAILV